MFTHNQSRIVRSAAFQFRLPSITSGTQNRTQKPPFTDGFSQMREDTQRTIRGVALFCIPLIGAYLPVGSVDLIVPRGHREQALAKISGEISLNAEVLAAFYHVAISGAVVFVVCITSLWCCINWLLKTGLPEARDDERPWIWISLVVAVALPTILLLVQLMSPANSCKFSIDDCVTKLLLAKTIRQKLDDVFFAMNHDIDFLAWIVFLTYLVAAATVATAAGTFHPSEPQQGAENEQKASERRATINMTLFLTAAVLVSAMVAVKFRFDIGLASLGSPPAKTAPNPAFSAYQTLASAIMTYWASVLSLWLALIYVPSAYVLSERTSPLDEGRFSHFFSLNRENAMRLLKLAAIVSPPIVNKLLEVFTAIPKGT
jgi:hypothetical protein